MVDALKQVRRARKRFDAATDDVHAAMRTALDCGFSLREVGEAAGFSHEYVRREVARQRRSEDLIEIYRATNRGRRWVRRRLAELR